MKAAILENGTVVNVAKVSDQAFADSQGWIVSNTAKIGDTYDVETGTFTSPPLPPPTVPSSVTKRQAKEALIMQGKYQQCLDALAGIVDPIEKAIAENYWSEAQTFDRDSEVLNTMAEKLTMTPNDLDDLFRYAATL